MNDRTHQEMAPAALFRDANPNDPYTFNYLVNCSHPLLSAQAAASLCTPALIAADVANPGSNSAGVRISRRNYRGWKTHLGCEHTNYRTVVGAKDVFAGAWDYDAYSPFYYTQISGGTHIRQRSNRRR